MTRPSPTSDRRPARWAFALVILAVIAILLYLVFYDAEDSLLAPSGPDETVLRTLRLAGIEHAAIGEADGVAVLRVEIPTIASHPDVEIVWQTGFAALSSTRPRAGRYVVQLFAESAPLVELTADGGAVRAAVETDDPGSLRAASEAAFIARSGEQPQPTDSPEGDLEAIVAPDAAARARLLVDATPLDAEQVPPDRLAIDVNVVGAYLDAKNRAAGLLGSGGPHGAVAEELAEAAETSRRGAAPVAAPGPGESVVERYVRRLEAALDGDVGGVSGLRDEVAELVERGDRAAVSRIRALTIAAEALSSPMSGGSLLAGTSSIAEEVADTPLTPGALSDAVLAAADADGAPERAVRVATFERQPSLDLDVTGALSGSSLPATVLRLHAEAGTQPALGWSDRGGGGTAAPETWLGYRRGDGAVYWLAGEEGDVALTDGSVLGWAFSTKRATLVDAERCGRALARFALE